MPMRASFLVDGFNMYHSLLALQEATRSRVKWLDLVTLCRAYLQAVRSAVGQPVELARVHYFSARPSFLVSRQPDKVRRYDTYIAALRHSGVEVHLARFKPKESVCPRCKQAFRRHEEKETDVAMAMAIVEVLVTGECDTVVLVTGDTDLIPALQATKRLLPRAKIGVAFPHLRHNNELEAAAHYSFKIDPRDVRRAQFPPTIPLPDGSVLRKPAPW